VLLRRVCGHAGVINSRALSLLPAEITAKESPQNGLIREQALWKTEDLIPRDLAFLKQDFWEVLTQISALGITSVHEMIDGEETLELLDRAGSLPLDIFCYLPLAMSDRFGEIRRYFQAKKGRVEVVGVKIFADGSIGAGTAALEKPYRGEPENRGSLLFSDREMGECLENMVRLGVPFAIHAIGDRAISQILAVAPGTRKAGGLRERPHGWNRIEHAELLRNDHLEGVKRGGFSLSMQPNFVANWQAPGGLYEQKLGKRGRQANPFRQVWDAGIPLCFGSDSMPPGPLLGIQGALYHPVAAQRLSLWQAVLAYTRGSADAISRETSIGSIAVGCQADLVAVTPDFVESPDAAVIVMTVKAGEVVYSQAG
ncbi:MAG: amidohydrolase family protein, partial [Candidatus Tectomicrobia bacterium]|nr:amidohydrolase family protein [Candidatus Tectomicrobia bacterium]